MGLLLCVLLCFLGRLDRLGRRSLLTADRPAINLELRAVARRLDDQNVVLDVDNAADKTTDGGDLITCLLYTSSRARTRGRGRAAE